jgi:spermidine synthase
MVFQLKEESESFRDRDKAALSVDKVERPARWQFALVAACFLVSGFAALLYETVWLRQFAVLLGTSEQALAIVLASYMGGLALGSLVSSRYVDSLRRPLLTYGLLELGIAVAALLIPIGLSFARMLQHNWLGGQPEPPPAGGSTQMIFSFVVTLGLILIPTSFMGATLPLLARHVVRRDEELGQKIGILYAINTAGAVLGTMTAAFVLMPSIGMRATTWVGAAANLFVFGLIIALVCRPASLERPEGTIASPSQTQTHRKRRRGRDKKMPDQAAEPLRYGWILWLTGLSGAISFSYEIIFTRMLGHLLGGSVYACYPDS